MVVEPLPHIMDEVAKTVPPAAPVHEGSENSSAPISGVVPRLSPSISLVTLTFAPFDSKFIANEEDVLICRSADDTNGADEVDANEALSLVPAAVSVLVYERRLVDGLVDDALNAEAAYNDEAEYVLPIKAIPCLVASVPQ